MVRCCVSRATEVYLLASLILAKEYILLCLSLSRLQWHLELALLLLLLSKNLVLVRNTWCHISHISDHNLLTITNELTGWFFKISRIWGKVKGAEVLSRNLDMFILHFTNIRGGLLLYYPCFVDTNAYVKLRVINALNLDVSRTELRLRGLL